MLKSEPVPVSIGGHDLLLRYPAKVLADLQRLLEVRTLLDVLARIEALQPNVGEEGVDAQLLAFSMDDLILVLWAGIGPAGGHEVYRSPNAMGLEIDVHMVPDLLMRLQLAVARQMVPPQEAADNPDPPPQAVAAPSP
ncbi:MAG: hypothetical protein RJA36_1443 [Pseudomonadota bacterium]